MGTHLLMETFQRMIVSLFPLLFLLYLCCVADGSVSAIICPEDDIGTEETTYEWKCFEDGRAACYRSFRHCGCDCISECEGYPYTTGKKVCKKEFSDQCFWER